jgi:hypothetical protein
LFVSPLFYDYELPKLSKFYCDAGGGPFTLLLESYWLFPLLGISFELFWSDGIDGIGLGAGVGFDVESDEI